MTCGHLTNSFGDRRSFYGKGQNASSLLTSKVAESERKPEKLEPTSVATTSPTETFYQELCEKYSSTNENFNETVKRIINDATEWCEAGYSALKWIECLRCMESPKKTMITMCYHKIKPDVRSEKLLVYYAMYFTFVSSNEYLENILVS